MYSDCALEWRSRTHFRTGTTRTSGKDPKHLQLLEKTNTLRQ